MKITFSNARAALCRRTPMLLALFFGVLCQGDLLHAAAGTDGTGTNPSELLLRVQPGGDATPLVRTALERCRKEGIHRLKLAPGRYDFWPEEAFEKYVSVSNNGGSLKRIAFGLVGFEGLEIDGAGAELVFHNFMVPFLVENSRNISIKNLSVDFARPFHSEGKVLAITPESVDLEISEEFPYAVRNGVLVFTDGGTATRPENSVRKPGEVLFPCGSLLAFDPVRRETAYMAGDRYGLASGIPASEIGPRKVRLNVTKVKAEPGNVLVFGAGHRSMPGIIITESAKTTVENVSIYHCGGMGVVGQLSSDIELNKVRITPPPSGKRVVSITADATHYVNCTGRIVMRNCLFENQKDDATNIHGLYAPVLRVLGPDKFEIRMANEDQRGLYFIRPGMRLEVVDSPSMVTREEVVVKSVEHLNTEISLVTTEKPFSGLQKGDCVASADANTAEVLIENCTFRGNRARGLLLGSRGKITIAGNTFHTPGSAILFEGDACGWFEQAGVREVMIRKNTFDNCNFGVWGKTCIQVAAGIKQEFRKTSRYNHNITIEENLFRLVGNRGILSMYSVDGLKFRNNRMEQGQDYPAVKGPAPELLEVVDSDNVALEQPKVAGTTGH